MNVYITSTGHFLPGDPVGNGEIEDVLGRVHGRPSRLKDRILRANGIRTRHYAIDRQHRTTISNAGMAAKAGQACLNQAGLARTRVRMLSAATSQGDLVLPGFGSMVQAELGIPDVELHTSHGICSSSMMAMKAAWTSIRSGEQPNSLVIASELSSRLFKASHYEAAGATLDFNAEFLRWMLSDGAGAALLEQAPRGRSYRIDWIRSYSHADAYPVCMSVGRTACPDDPRSWQDFPTYAAAEAAGALLIRQDVRLLENSVKLGVDGFLRLLDEGLLRADGIDHMLCHYSSHHFRSRIFAMLEAAGAAVPEERWYTNLYTRGNTGCASILIMLDEFRRSRAHQVGDRILCMVPESGRFNNAYMHLTVVEESR